MNTIVDCIAENQAASRGKRFIFLSETQSLAPGDGVCSRDSYKKNWLFFGCSLGFSAAFDKAGRGLLHAEPPNTSHAGISQTGNRKQYR
jgi:hypothetical protein